MCLYFPIYFWEVYTRLVTRHFLERKLLVKFLICKLFALLREFVVLDSLYNIHVPFVRFSWLEAQFLHRCVHFLRGIFAICTCS